MVNCGACTGAGGRGPAVRHRSRAEKRTWEMSYMEEYDFWLKDDYFDQDTKKEIGRAHV